MTTLSHSQTSKQLGDSSDNSNEVVEHDLRLLEAQHNGTSSEQTGVVAPEAPDPTMFKDLAPIDDADIERGYLAALSFAMSGERVRNIGLSGPYSSGKSSVIATFAAKCDGKKFLNISLASFSEAIEPEDVESGNKDRKPTDNDIERSILQQMLYSAPANDLPFSRFKRITTPEHTWKKMLALALWSVAVIYIADNWSSFSDISNARSVHLGKVLLSVFTLLGFTAILSGLYKASFGHSLKKLSLKNAEIETHAPDETSILNHHLDEIVYFFEQTDYNVVVIEDLDRFETPEIFVKLREINKLINAQRNKNDPVKFIYAMRDDIFSDRNRAKFFDIIIPIVPVINTSNSLYKMQERITDSRLPIDIGGDFLNETSLYIDDLRLIHNIFNEFIVYLARLKSSKLDDTKLLAMMIYKNVYPSDFEKLHHGNGAFHSICARRASFILKVKSDLTAKIRAIEAAINSSEAEEAHSIDELVKIYLAQIISHVPKGTSIFWIVAEDEEIAYQDMLTIDKFDLLVGKKDILFGSQQQAHPNYRRSLGVSFQEIEIEVNPREDFNARRRNIENRSAQQRVSLQRQISEIEQEIASVSRLPFSDLLEKANIDYATILAFNGLTNGDLLIYLVKNGHLDDNYFQYISSFHEGRLSRSDRDFLLNIRNFGKPEPDQRLDNPAEVCRIMREEDFRSRHAFNCGLLDYLLPLTGEKDTELSHVYAYASDNFEKAEGLIISYYAQGQYPDEFLNGLISRWPGFIDAVVADAKYAEHLRHLLAYSDKLDVLKRLKENEKVSEFISANVPLVFADSPPTDVELDLVQALEIRFADLPELEPFERLRELALERNLYTLNVANVTFAFNAITAASSASNDKVSYSSILDLQDVPLKNYVEDHIKTFVTEVLLTQDDGPEESEDAIAELLNNSALEDADKERILAWYDHTFDSFDRLPTSLWTFMLHEQKIELSWLNAARFLTEQKDNGVLLAQAMQAPENIDRLIESSAEFEELADPESSALSDLIFNDSSMRDAEYCRLMRCLPVAYDMFPADVSEQKLHCLADSGRVILTESAFEFCSSNTGLKAKLLASNIETFLERKTEFEINDDIRKLLLTEDITAASKESILQDIAWEAVSEDTEFLERLTALLLSPDIQFSRSLNKDLLVGTISAQSSIRLAIQLLTKAIPILKEKQVMGILASMEFPYNQIAKYGKQPKLPKTDFHLKFLTALTRRRYISSYSMTYWGSIRVYTKRKPSAA